MSRLQVIGLLSLAALFAAVPALAQSSQKVWRVGVLTTGSAGPAFESFRTQTLPELAKQGFVEGKNLIVDFRAGTQEQLPERARELVGTGPDAVIAVSVWAIRAVQQASRSIPIIAAFSGEDPVAAGFAASLARPGGQVTGIVVLAPELSAKRLQVLHDAVPIAKRIAVLARSAQLDGPSIAETEKAAERSGLNLSKFYAPSPANYASVFTVMREGGMQALVTEPAPEFATNAAALASLALQSHLPTVCEWDWMARDGCLLGYGADMDELRRRTADYVVQIFHGISPGNLPMEQPTHFKFAINLRTAKDLRLMIPPAILARADEVIE
jgi:putative ABC transport system substrate-binding protein